MIAYNKKKSDCIEYDQNMYTSAFNNTYLPLQIALKGYFCTYNVKEVILNNGSSWDSIEHDHRNFHRKDFNALMFVKLKCSIDS